MDRREIALRTVMILTESLTKAEESNDMDAFFKLLKLLRDELNNITLRQE